MVRTSPASVVDCSNAALPEKVWVMPSTTTASSTVVASMRMNGPASTETVMVSLPTIIDVSTAAPVVFRTSENVPLANVRALPGVVNMTLAVACPTTPAVVTKNAPLIAVMLSVAALPVLLNSAAPLAIPTLTVASPLASDACSKAKSPLTARPPRLKKPSAISMVTPNRRYGPLAVVSMASEIASSFCSAPRLIVTESVKGSPTLSTVAVPISPSLLSTNMPSAPVTETMSVVPSPSASDTSEEATVTCLLLPVPVTLNPKLPVRRWPSVSRTTLVASKERSPLEVSTSTESTTSLLSVKVID